ncbi:ATP-dependent Clp protease ATP-binding subunit CLPT1, chloroplastic [Vitis vinifera]|uniref:ATP-dependent Clp protease ATP-binding subunit CLPT1, chloroplastic n=1 Tax=Vitis vinifera TaxID=29760 RepID=A0A438JH50_VITVI|nr:ATP-dependent Clp protease ATP-binding subunit CLPT1, chloroplastic [Vitis vinifera]
MCLMDIDVQSIDSVLLFDICIIGEEGEITTSHLLLGIWAEEESAGHKILATLGFNDDKAKELAKSINKETDLSF